MKDNFEKIHGEKSLYGNLEKDAFFDLADESEELKSWDPKFIDQTRLTSLQKLHVRNHSASLKETVHKEFCQPESDPDLLSEEDEYLYKEIVIAIGEGDIIDLREKVKAILQSPIPNKVLVNIKGNQPSFGESNTFFGK